MKISAAGSKLSIVLVASLALILIVLAVLQYRWSGQISESDRERIQASLDSSVSQFRVDFNREIMEIATSFQPEGREPAVDNRTRVARQYREWSDTAPYADLVSNLYLGERSSDDSVELFKLAAGSEMLEQTAWPDNLSSIRNAPWRQITNPRRMFGDPRRMPWFIYPSVPALVHPVFAALPREGRRGIPRSLEGWVIVDLDEAVLRRKLLPDLAHRYFSGPRGFVYQVEVIGGREPGESLYRSHPDLPGDSFDSPDVRIPLFLQPREYLARGPGEPEQPQLGRGPGIAQGPPDSQPFSAMARMLRRRGPFMLTVVGEDHDWELLVQHTQGSLDAAVANLRNRNLAISFGILLLLALSMTMIIITTQRAKRLAKLQMEFVAGVSHELRTPLAVIRSAGENLADGVVADSKRQVKQYGELVLAEGRRLSDMVEQILQFAKIQAGRKKYKLQPGRVSEVLQVTLDNAQSMIESEGVTLEREIQSDLPMARIDANTLSQCLQNLINNALKYGGENRWMRIKASSSDSGGKPEIHIAIEDKGIGIDPADLPHIFDPFFRGTGATSAQIHGSGLGLSMARDAVTAMGGRITVKSTPGSGSTFTIHLPALDADKLGSEASSSD